MLRVATRRVVGRGGALVRSGRGVSTEAEVLEANKRLVEAVASRDVEAYKRLVCEDVSCFEPEGAGHLVQGRQFHEYYFDYVKREEIDEGMTNVTLCSPSVRFASEDVAIVSFVKLCQEGFATRRTEETRIWKKDDEWKLVHFHRSIPGMHRSIPGMQVPPRGRGSGNAERGPGPGRGRRGPPRRFESPNPTETGHE